MGLFDWLRKKPKIEEVSVKEIKISELMDEVKRIENEKFSEFYNRFSEYNKRIIAISKELDKKAAALGKARINEKDVDERLLIKIKSAKDNLTNKIKFMCSTKLNEGFDFSSFESIKESIERIEAIGAELNTAGAKYTGAVALVNKRELNSMSLTIKSLVSLFRELREYFEKNDKVSGFELLYSKSKKITDLSEFRKKIGSETESKQKERETKEKHISELKSKIKEIEDSENYKKVKAIEKDIDDTSSEINNEKYLLRNKFSEFGKALNKFVHDCPLSSEQEKLAEAYLGEPYDAMDTDRGFEITKLLSELKKAVDSGKLGLDERIQNKSSQALSEFIDKELLKTALEKKNELRSRIADKEKELEQSGVFELNAQSLKLKDAEKRLHDIKTTIELQDELLKKNSDGIEKLKKEVAELLIKFSINAKIN